MSEEHATGEDLAKMMADTTRESEVIYLGAEAAGATALAATAEVTAAFGLGYELGSELVAATHIDEKIADGAHTLLDPIDPLGAAEQEIAYRHHLAEMDQRESEAVLSATPVDEPTGPDT